MTRRPHDLARRARRALVDRSRQLDRLRTQVEAIERLLREQAARQDELMERLRDVQGLVARAYETPLDWPRQLAALRAEPDYGLPWQEPEPLVSVRIATFDNAELLCERTLASVRVQTYERWEAVVVGDGVTDDTAARIAAIGDQRIRFVDLPYRGPYPADEKRRWLVAGTGPANAALRESKGRWIAPLDHDDEFDTDHIEVLLERARAERAELVYGRLRVRLAETGESLPNVVGAWPPAFSQFAFQASIYHAGLRRFEYDDAAYLAGEPGDWNLGRRMWQAGVAFSFLDRIVATYYWTPMDEQGHAWLEWGRGQAKVDALDAGVGRGRNAS